MIVHVKNALTLCWRVFLWLIVAFIAGIAMAYYVLLPDLKSLQLDLERVIQQELKLSSLELGELAWTWGWNLGVSSKHASFSRDDLGVSLKDTDLDIHFSLRDVLQGHLWPKSILVQGGKADISMPDGDAPSVLILPPIRILLKNITVHWVWKTHTSNFHIQAFKLLPSLHEMRLRTPSFQAMMKYNKSFKPTWVEADFQSFKALPKIWRDSFKGHVSGHIEVQSLRLNQQVSWQGRWSLQGKKRASLYLKKPVLDIPFDRIQGHFSFVLSSKGKPIEWQLKDVLWVHAKAKILADVNWKQQHFTLKATSPQLSMPLIWSWLKPLQDNSSWHTWLATMHTGVAKKVHVKLGFKWDDFLNIPTDLDWESLQYHVKANVENMDISLGELGVLQHTRALIDLNEHVLHANIYQTELPQNIGKVSASLDISWDTLVMDIKGKGDVDVALLQKWASKASSLKEFSWLSATPAQASFSLQWQLDLDDFTSIFLYLKPLKPWQLQLYEHVFWLDSGELIWDMKQGLTAKSLQLRDDDMQGKVNFSLFQNPDHPSIWTLKSLDGEMQGELPIWVERYALPVELVAGNWKTSINFNGKQWRGDLNLKGASWGNILGSHKKQGEPWKLHYQGTFFNQTLHLKKISSQQAPLQLDAYGDVSLKHIDLHITHLKTSAMLGQVHFNLPLERGVWQINVRADYLNRHVFPSHFPKIDGIKQQQWHVLADIKDVEWYKTRMQGVSLNMSSQGGTLSHFKADSMVSKALLLQKIHGDFNILEAGKIDLLKLSALQGKKHVSISAMLTPEATGGMAWQGYAQLAGSLGDLMQQAKLSSLLGGGKMHAVLLGKGFIFRDQPWWQGLRGRLRLHSEDGQILNGGTLTKFLAVLSWADLPQLLLAYRPDLTREGLVYNHLWVEATIYDRKMRIKQLRLDSSAMQLAGKGSLSLDTGDVDMMLVAQPFQNLDAVLTTLPLLGRVLGGDGHSIFRRAYHIYGPVSDAQVDGVSPEDAGAPRSGLIDRLLNFPDALFGGRKKVPH